MRLAGSLPPFQTLADPWLPFEWALQIGDGVVYADPEVAEIEWARGILQLRQSHPPVPVARPRSGHSGVELLTFCWGLNRVVQAAQLDHALQAAGYDLVSSKSITHTQVVQAAPRIREFARVLLCLELLYREISIAEQNDLKAACGEDVMRAAFQMNMMCIDPNDADRTLLQVQRIGLKLCGDAELQVRAGIQIMLSDGRILD